MDSHSLDNKTVFRNPYYKGAKENEDQGFNEFYEKPNKEDPTKEDQDGRYPLSAINRLTLNMLKVSKKIF